MKTYNKLPIFLATVLMVVSFSFGSFADAATVRCETGSPDARVETGDCPDKVINLNVTVDNPLRVDTFEGFIKEVLNIVLMIGIPIVALAIIYAGFLFVTAQGNEEKLTAAKQTLLYVIIGAALLLGAWVLAEAIAGTVNQLKS